MFPLAEARVLVSLVLTDAKWKKDCMVLRVGPRTVEVPLSKAKCKQLRKLGLPWETR